MLSDEKEKRAMYRNALSTSRISYIGVYSFDVRNTDTMKSAMFGVIKVASHKHSPIIKKCQFVLS